MNKQIYIRRQGILIILFLTMLVFLVMIFNHNDDITVSYDSGFYNDEFDVIVGYNKTGKLYYTTDGSIPSNQSILYDGPIHIGDASDNENIYSMIADTSLGNQKERVKDLGWNHDSVWYMLPQYKLDKATILSLAYYDKFGSLKKQITKVYFVGFNNKDGYDSMPVIAITTDPENLFGYEKGIYVLGKKFDEFMEKEDKVPFWFWADGNFFARGSEWERDAQLTIFSSEKQLLYEGNIGIRVQGSSSRAAIPKSMNLYNRELDKNPFPDVLGRGYHQMF